MRSFYDWQDCIGRSQCVMSVQQSWMPSCGNYSQFLQADYTCVPRKIWTFSCCVHLNQPVLVVYIYHSGAVYFVENTLINIKINHVVNRNRIPTFIAFRKLWTTKDIKSLLQEQLK